MNERTDGQLDDNTHLSTSYGPPSVSLHHFSNRSRMPEPVLRWAFYGLLGASLFSVLLTHIISLHEPVQDARACATLGHSMDLWELLHLLVYTLAVVFCHLISSVSFNGPHF